MSPCREMVKYDGPMILQLLKLSHDVATGSGKAVLAAAASFLAKAAYAVADAHGKLVEQGTPKELNRRSRGVFNRREGGL